MAMMLLIKIKAPFEFEILLSMAKNYSKLTQALYGHGRRVKLSF